MVKGTISLSDYSKKLKKVFNQELLQKQRQKFYYLKKQNLELKGEVIL